MEQLYTTPDGKIVYLVANPAKLTDEQRKLKGMGANGFPSGVPTEQSKQTILAGYERALAEA